MDHLSELQILDGAYEQTESRVLNVLELGAGAGLPGISVARLLSAIWGDRGRGFGGNEGASLHSVGDRFRWHVTLSDYPDDLLIHTLQKNVERNMLSSSCCRVVPFEWGKEDVSELLFSTKILDLHMVEGGHGFDIIIAADTLWNPSLHGPFYDTLVSTLRPQSTSARVHLIAGLHTGRYTIEGFLKLVRFKEAEARSLVLDRLEEREINGDQIRPWLADRGGEDDNDKWRWLVWITLKWNAGRR